MRLRLLTFALLFSAALAARADDITVRDAWVREAPPGAAVLAAYLTLENHSERARQLVAARSPDFDRIEIHATVVRDGVASMMALETLDIEARGRTALAPGGTHLMLIGPHRPLSAGQRVALTLVFAGGETLELTVPVRSRAAEPEHRH
jgi:copper(I)-binding protein